MKAGRGPLFFSWFIADWRHDALPRGACLGALSRGPSSDCRCQARLPALECQLAHMMASDQARFAASRLDGGAGPRRVGSAPGHWLCAGLQAAACAQRQTSASSHSSPPGRRSQHTGN